MTENIEKSALGQHLIIDYFKCACDALSDPKFIEDLIIITAKKMNATIIMSNFHHFSPLGVSGVLVIAESHITIHTWPEHNYVALDIFFCGELDIEAGLDYFQTAIQSSQEKRQSIPRGRHIDL